MIDELLGRAELKQRITELKDERDSLQAQLDAEAERRQTAVRDRQTAQEERNRLEDRITELEDRLERADDGSERTLRGREAVGPDRAAELFDRLASLQTTTEGALSAAVHEELPEAVTTAFGDRAGLVRRVTPGIAYRDDAGLVSVVVDPPLRPEPFCEWNDGFRVDHSWVEPTGETLFVLVRSDSFVAGVYDDDSRVAFDRFTTDVTSEHDKGGFSQARFERRREEEITAHVERADERLGELVETHGPDRCIVVGERQIVGQLADHATHTGSADATGSDEAALRQAFRDFWTTQIVLV